MTTTRRHEKQESDIIKQLEMQKVDTLRKLR